MQILLELCQVAGHGQPWLTLTICLVVRDGSGVKTARPIDMLG
jgi:hypothetical protein